MEEVYTGYSNPIKLRITEVAFGVRNPVDFTEFNSVLLQFGGASISATKKEADGTLEFQNVGNQGIPPGEYAANLIADGQALAHEATGDLIIRVY